MYVANLCTYSYLYILNYDDICNPGTAPFTNGIAAVIISDIQCAVTYTITAEGMLNGTLVGPGSSHGNVTAESCPSVYAAIRMYVHVIYM